jgi:hypothetical protein
LKPPGQARDLASGILLIAGSGAGVVVMGLHPTAHGLVNPDSGAHLTRVNEMVHGLALAAVPAVFLGLLGLARRLAPSDLATAGLVAYGWASVAVLSAAVASGFVAPGVITDEAFLSYTHLLNQGFAKVNVVASCVAILLFAAAILRGGRLSRAAGVFGAAVSAAILLLFFVGHLRLDVHGFGIVILAQSAWLIWIGILLCRERAGTVP